MEESERKELIEFYHDAFDSAVKSGVFEDVPEIWDELIKLDPDNTEAFLSMAEELERLRRNKIAGEMLVSLIKVYRETGNTDGRKAALFHAISLAPADEQLKGWPPTIAKRARTTRCWRRRSGGPICCGR